LTSWEAERFENDERSDRQPRRKVGARVFDHFVGGDFSAASLADSASAAWNYASVLSLVMRQATPFAPRAAAQSVAVGRATGEPEEHEVVAEATDT